MQAIEQFTRSFGFLQAAAVDGVVFQGNLTHLLQQFGFIVGGEKGPLLSKVA